MLRLKGCLVFDCLLGVLSLTQLLCVASGGGGCPVLAPPAPAADRRLQRSWRQSPRLPHIHRDLKQCGVQRQHIYSTRRMHPCNSLDSPISPLISIFMRHVACVSTDVQLVFFFFFLLLLLLLLLLFFLFLLFSCLCCSRSSSSPSSLSWWWCCCC